MATPASLESHSSLLSAAAPIGDELGCPAGVFLIEIRPCHTAPPSAALAESMERIVYKCLHGTAPLLVNSACRRTSAPEVDFGLRRHHRWSFAVRDCQLSATELSQLPQLMFGTVYRNT